MDAQAGTEIAEHLDTEELCDRCGARARVIVILASGRELLFCGHHATRHRAALEKISAWMEDANAPLAR